MTIAQKLQSLLENHGLFDTQAKAVIEVVKTDPANESMLGRWDDDVEGYPPQLLNVLWYSAKVSARQWIAENIPNAWFRPLFEQEA